MTRIEYQMSQRRMNKVYDFLLAVVIIGVMIGLSLIFQ